MEHLSNVEICGVHEVNGMFLRRKVGDVGSILSLSSGELDIVGVAICDDR